MDLSAVLINAIINDDVNMVRYLTDIKIDLKFRDRKNPYKNPYTDAFWECSEYIKYACMYDSRNALDLIIELCTWHPQCHILIRNIVSTAYIHNKLDLVMYIIDKSPVPFHNSNILELICNEPTYSNIYKKSSLLLHYYYDDLNDNDERKFRFACKYSTISIVKHILAKNNSLKYGLSRLSGAFRRKRTCIIEMLINRCPDLQKYYTYYYQIAYQKNDHETMKYLNKLGITLGDCYEYDENGKYWEEYLKNDKTYKHYIHPWTYYKNKKYEYGMDYPAYVPYISAHGRYDECYFTDVLEKLNSYELNKLSKYGSMPCYFLDGLKQFLPNHLKVIITNQI